MALFCLFFSGHFMIFQTYTSCRSISIVMLVKFLFLKCKSKIVITGNIKFGFYYKLHKLFFFNKGLQSETDSFDWSCLLFDIILKRYGHLELQKRLKYRKHTFVMLFVHKNSEFDEKLYSLKILK